jgi:tetratricopeptide (TPR) repeat protein
MAAIPARWALERGAWNEAARLDLRPSDLPYVEALTVFARGIGSARSGDVDGARRAVSQLEALRASESKLNEPYWTEQIAIQRRGAAAWLAHAEGRTGDAIAELRAAAEAEDLTEKAAVTPGPLAPAREQLGELLLATKDAPGALKEFEATLRREPNRFRAVHGAARAASLAGDAATARRYFAQLVKMCAQATTPVRPELQEARTVVERR